MLKLIMSPLKYSHTHTHILNVWLHRSNSRIQLLPLQQKTKFCQMSCYFFQWKCQSQLTRAVCEHHVLAYAYFKKKIPTAIATSLWPLFVKHFIAVLCWLGRLLELISDKPTENYHHTSCFSAHSLGLIQLTRFKMLCWPFFKTMSMFFWKKMIWFS